MSLPEWLRSILPGDTADTWHTIRDVVPASGYLAGGTAIAIHLQHRTSRDLDFFNSEPEDLGALRRDLEQLGAFAVTLHTDDTLNGIFNSTKLQFLDAQDQVTLEPLTVVEGIRVAGLGDLLATKLKVVGDRGELRDYFDLMVIEERGGRRAEEGIALFLRRYCPRDPDAAVRHILLGLGYFDDVGEDPFLPQAREDIATYWRRRQPEIARALARR